MTDANSTYSRQESELSVYTVSSVNVSIHSFYVSSSWWKKRAASRVSAQHPVSINSIISLPNQPPNSDFDTIHPFVGDPTRYCLYVFFENRSWSVVNTVSVTGSPTVEPPFCVWHLALVSHLSHGIEIERRPPQ